jgi:hypothetical protein
LFSVVKLQAFFAAAFRALGKFKTSVFSLFSRHARFYWLKRQAKPSSE